MRVAVLGATGHTGRLVVRALRERGAGVRACGRDEAALARLAEAHGVETMRVDVTDAGEVRAALRGVDGVANLAGPFLATGAVPVEAALRRAIPYVDTTGEQAFMHLVQRRYGARAVAMGAPVVNALAYEYALADLAARAHLPEGGDALHVLYRNRGAMGSLGTKKTILRVLGAPALVYEDGRLVRAPPARFRRVFQTDDGPRDAMSFPGGEALTVPRHTPFDTVRAYVPAPPSRIRAARVLAPVARLALRGPVLRLAERRVEARHREPENEEAGAEIHLVAEGPDRRVVLRMGDPYGVTAEACAEGLTRLVGSDKAGVLAPAEALDAAETLAALSRRLATFRVTTPGAVDETRK